MKQRSYNGYFKIIVSLLLSVVAIITVYHSIPAKANVGKWSDEGNYDAAWLGDYENTAAYTIKTSAELGSFLVASSSGRSFENKTVTMGADLDMSAHFWSCAFSSENPFLGTFDARGYVIKGLKFNSTDPVSAFIHTNKGTVVNALFSVSSQCAESAGIAHNNQGKILNSAIIGEIGADSSTGSGGIAVNNIGTIDNCYSLATVKGVSAGGICSKNTGTITSCAWDGIENGSGDASGLAESQKLSDKQAIIDKLNKRTKDNGWMYWTADVNSTFGGYPVLTSKEPTVTEVKVAGVSLNARQKVLWLNGTFDIKYTVLPANATNKNVKLFSTNEAVATVDPATGKVTAKARGYAVIRAITEDGNKVADCYVTVKTGSKPTGIKLENTHFSITAGKPIQLKYSITPSGASYWGATFSSADTSIVDCSESGVIVGLQPGVTVVTATTGDGGRSISAMITVVEDTYSEVWAGNMAEEFGGGDGTRENPYLIDNGAHLALLAYNVNNGTDYKNTWFKQTVGIMLNDTTVEDWTNILTTINEWSPIGTQDNPFLGNYDAGGFSVSGIYNNSSEYAGLFGYTAKGATISNLTIRNSIIRGGEYVGAICAYNNAEISDCEAVTSVISGTGYVGGICGYTSSSLNYCKNYAAITADKYAGGIAGRADAVIVNCSNYGNVTANSHVGGIVGQTPVYTENCLNTVTVNGATYVGGIAGEATMGSVNCYSSAFPSAQSFVGMICGYSEKPIASYTLENYVACGNRENDELYELELLGDDSLVVKATGEYFLDILNTYYGCLASDSYFRWELSEEGDIKPSYMKYHMVSISNKETGVTLEGRDIDVDSDYAFAVPDSDELRDILSIVNNSVVFGTKALQVDDVMFSVRYNSDAFVSGVTHRMSVPFAIDLSSRSFSQITLINVNDSLVDIYIPEIVHELADGSYIGMFKCVSHSWDVDEYVDLGDNGDRYTFVYSNGAVMTPVMCGGVWMTVDLGDNKYVVPIETGTSNTPETNSTPQTVIGSDIGNTVTILLGILVLGTSVIVVIIQREKNNNLMPSSEARDDSDNTDKNE